MNSIGLKTVIRSFAVFILVVSISSSGIAEELSDKVTHRLEQEKLGAHEIDITTRRGIVKLSGWVSSQSDKELIINSVKSMEGVEEVADALKVEEKGMANVVLDDNKVSEQKIAEVSAAAQNYLRSLQLKGPYTLTYNFTDQGILIKGELPAGTEKQALLYHVRRHVNTPVQENIVVRPWPSDKELVLRVRSQIGTKQGIDLNGISVSSVDGVVTLKGVKANHREADQLAAATLMVEGVRDVKSEVTFSGSRSDP